MILRRWFSITALLTYGLIAEVIYLFEASGVVGWWLFVLGLLAVVVGLIRLIRAAIRREARLIHWILLVIYLILYYLAFHLSIG